jgi:hypothetical protein
MQASKAFEGRNHGMASISYQNIEDLLRLKNSNSGRLYFLEKFEKFKSQDNLNFFLFAGFFRH